VAKIGNWEYTVATRHVYWSDEVFRIYGLSPDQPMPPPEQLAKLYHPDDYPAYEPVAIRAFTHGEAYDTDVRIVTPAGATKYVNIIARPVRDASGNVDQVYGTVMDITDRKQAEHTLHLRNEELQKINHQLDNFVYRAGHDLRAPLVSILGLIQIAQMEPDADQKDAYMGLMQRSVQKLDTFIQDIIHYSRNVRTEVKREPVDFRQLAGEVIENLQFMKTFPVDISVAVDEPGALPLGRQAAVGGPAQPGFQRHPLRQPAPGPFVGAGSPDYRSHPVADHGGRQRPGHRPGTLAPGVRNVLPGLRIKPGLGPGALHRAGNRADTGRHHRRGIRTGSGHYVYGVRAE
jgi:PAS domain S-box-containing protein